MLVALAGGGLFVTTFPGHDALSSAHIVPQEGSCDSYVETHPQVDYIPNQGYMISGWETRTTSQECVGDTVQVIVGDAQGEQSVARGTLSLTPVVLVSDKHVSAERATGIVVLVTK